MIHPRTLATSVLAALLLFAGPAALADPGDDKARGRCAKGEDHPGNGNGPKCEPKDDTSSAPAEEDPSTEESSEESSNEGSSQGSNEGSQNKHPHGGPPGRSDNSSGGRPATQPSPSPSGTPPGQTAGDVIVTVSVSRSIAQVGTTLTYTITAQNPGTATVSPTITNAIPDEVLFMSATGQPVPTFSSGTLTWVPTLEPGRSLALTWQGRVADEGDLDATNVVTAPGAAPVETHTYLAAVKGLVLNRSAAEPDWGTHEERKVVFSTEERDASGALSDDEVQASSGVLPYTGAPVVPLVVLAALLVLGGCMLMTQRGRRLSAIGLLVVLVAAACTSESPPRDQATESDDGGEEDEVLGTRVGRGDDGTGTTDEDDSDQDDGTGTTDEDDSDQDDAGGSIDDEAPADDEATDVTDPTTIPDDPAPAEEPETVTTREVVIVEVPNDPPAPSALRASGGDNRIVLDWDAATRSILSAFSTAIFRADSPIQFLASLEEGGDGIVSRISMTNVTDDERLLVSGTLVLEVSGPAGTFELSSPQLQEILDPSDEVSATFEFALPSGDYQIEAAYVTG